MYHDSINDQLGSLPIVYSNTSMVLPNETAYVRAYWSRVDIDLIHHLFSPKKIEESNPTKTDYYIVFRFVLRYCIYIYICIIYI